MLDLIKVSARVRERFSLSFPSWHLPKVLILQSASARAGADRTFSDQYLGKGARDCCVWSSYHVGCTSDPEDGTLCMRTLIM